MQCPIPAGVHAIDPSQLDLRPDEVIDQIISHPAPVINEKNVWFFWHSGFANMHPYTKRNVRAWHRRLTRHGWVIRVMDRDPSSPSNIAHFLDITNPATFPQAFIDGRIGGSHAAQHTSDLVRWPLLLRYGGVYADVGMLQIGDLNRLWDETLGNSDSPYQVLSYDGDSIPGRSLTNYFLCSNAQNPLFARCHKLFLQLWAEDGGKTSTDGMHASRLLKGVPPLQCPAYKADGQKYSAEEAGRQLTDYIIQGQAMSMIMGLVDNDDNWNGPEYVSKHVYAIEFMVGAQLINDMTSWDGTRAFELMSLKLPLAGEHESPDQVHARQIVEACLSKSFGFKLATGMIVRVMGDTLSSLWRKHEGSDDVPGTYAHWLRYGTLHWTQRESPPCIDLPLGIPLKCAPLLQSTHLGLKDE